MKRYRITANCLWGIIAASLLLCTGCAVAPPAAHPTPQTTSELKAPPGHVGGVGMHLGRKDGSLTVVATLPASPAFRAGLQSGDIIIAINGEKAETMTLPQAVNRIRGEPGTTVRLKALRPSTQEMKEYTVTRVDITNWIAEHQKQNSPALLPLSAEPTTPF